jgi:hypothetical protein
LFSREAEAIVIQLFLKYNPVKLFLVLLILLATRIIAYKIGIPLTDPELTWLLVGERMADGFTLYKEVWTDLEPFAAGVYYLLDLLFGKSTFVYFILSVFLVALQALLLNLGLNQNKVFKDPSSLPALFYVLFSSLFFDFYTLSPVLLGLTFLIMAFNMICYQARISNSGEERFFYIGILTGIASLFYSPFAAFLLFSLASLGFYSVTSLKKQMVLILAFSFPYFILLIYYFWIDNLGNYYQYAWLPILNSTPEFLIDLPSIIKIIVLPSLLLLAATAAIIARGKYIHYQYKIIKIAGLWLIAAIVALLFERTISSHLLLMLVPPLAFFTSHLFLISSKSKLVSEGFFFVMFGGIFLISFYALKMPDEYTKSHLIKTVPLEIQKLHVENKRVLVLGENREYYINNRISAPYIDWNASVWLFKDLKKYQNISSIYETILTGNPDYIVDKERRMDSLSILIPVFKQQYKRIDSTDIYFATPR